MELKHSLRDLKNQLLLGHCFIEVLWFQWDLIFASFLFIFFTFVFHRYLIYILINVEFISYFMQYSTYNYKIFSKFNYEIKYTFGRFAEIIPYTISGFMLDYFNLFDYLMKNKIKTINFICLVYILLYNFYMFIEPNGFGYSGIKLNIFASCLFINFLIIPRNFISKRINAVIRGISIFTPGIYYLHVPIMLYFQNIFPIIKNKTIYGSIFIYTICYIICFIGNIIFKKTNIKYIFQ